MRPVGGVVEVDGVRMRELAHPARKTPLFVTEAGRLLRYENDEFSEVAQYLNGGYMTFKIAKDMSYKVHRAVALAFVPNRGVGNSVNHIDGIKMNNHASNLEWCTIGENTQHAISMGLHPKQRTPIVAVHLERGDGLWFWSQQEAVKHGFSQPLIAKVLRGDRPHHKGYYWEYAA